MNGKLFIPITVALLCICLLLVPTQAIQQYMYVDGEKVPLQTDVPLYEYINKTDKTFKWEFFNKDANYAADLSTYSLGLTSQQWLTEELVSPSIWHHNLTLVRPQNLVRPDLCVLYITGCPTNADDCVRSQTDYVASLARRVGSYFAVLTQIPVQASVFSEDPEKRSRVEDALIAWTWRHYMDHPEHPDYVAYLPMAKAAKLALDTIEQYTFQATQKEHEFPVPITKFYVAGASKRGATTWLLSAFEGQNCLNHPQQTHCRLIGSAPMVYDVGNFLQSVPSMFQQLGSFSWAFTDYVDNGIVEFLNKPLETLETLTKVIDYTVPDYEAGLSYIPKLVVSAVGDQFFMPLNDYYWLPKVNNATRLMLPNADHSMLGALEYLSIGLSGHIEQCYTPPISPAYLRWEMNYDTNTMYIQSYPQPASVKVWRARTNPSTPARQDWRLTKLNIPGGCESPAVAAGGFCANPVIWTPTEVPYQWSSIEGAFISNYQEVDVPTDGQSWAGMYISVYWDGSTGVPSQLYTTQLMVLPHKYPFHSCVGEDNQCTFPLV